MNRLLFALTMMLALAGSIFGQTTNIIVNNGNYHSSGTTPQEYYINGIPKSADIGGVDVSTTFDNCTRAVNNRGFAFNDNLSYVSSLKFANYNHSPVTVVARVLFKCTVGMKPYPRYYDEAERVFNIVLGGAGTKDATKSIRCSNGADFDCEIIEADMIVRPLSH